jgi:NAD(P)-dependent dehydrogenase (short-subunit alcohol dehydrogenase family)
MARVLITGSNSGIGLETVFAMARAGHTVYATLRNLDKATVLRETIDREKLPVSILELDVTSDESVASAFSSIYKSGESIDVLINNAGIERMGPVEELPMEAFRTTMETNYFGPLRCIQACVGEMRRRRSGCIVNISSVAGRIPLSPLSPYVASKFALEALSEALAQELKAFNVRVAIVEPGIVDTPLARRLEDGSAASEYTQLRRCSELFTASLANQTPPSLIAEEILRIVESDTWQLRHPVGPDAELLLDWRESRTDEEWVALGALDDAAWYKHLENVFGAKV